LGVKKEPKMFSTQKRPRSPNDSPLRNLPSKKPNANASASYYSSLNGQSTYNPFSQSSLSHSTTSSFTSSTLNHFASLSLNQDKQTSAFTNPTSILFQSERLSITRKGSPPSKIFPDSVLVHPSGYALLCCEKEVIIWSFSKVFLFFISFDFNSFLPKLKL